MEQVVEYVVLYKIDGDDEWIQFSPYTKDQETLEQYLMLAKEMHSEVKVSQIITEKTIEDILHWKNDKLISNKNDE